MKLIVLACAFIITVTGPANAEKMYVGNRVEVTLRTGPGIDYKIVQMLQSGQEVKVLEPGKDWSRVLAIGGKEGWILSRYISPDTPGDLLLADLTQQHEKLMKHAAVLEEENTRFREENQKVTAELAAVKEAWNQLNDRYENLRNESADFLNLKTRYNKANLALSNQTDKVRELNEILRQRNIYIGLSGAAVLLFGFMIGYRTKKKRRGSSLL